MTAMYSLGMEEEYFVFDAKTRRAVRRIDKKFLAQLKKQLGGSVMTEMLQSQIEVATPPCATMAGGARASDDIFAERSARRRARTSSGSRRWAPFRSASGPSRR